MQDEDWTAEGACCLGVLLDGTSIRERDRRGRPIVDDLLLLLVDTGTSGAETTWTLPRLDDGRSWRVQVDTLRPDVADEEAGGTFVTDGRRVILLAAAGE